MSFVPQPLAAVYRQPAQSDEDYRLHGSHYSAVCWIETPRASGTLIAPTWVLTAAHYMSEGRPRSGDVVRISGRMSPDAPVAEQTVLIDYPETGPSDIYAMRAPRDALIVDHRRSRKTENGEAIKAFLAAYIQAREKPIEPFSMTVLACSPEKDFSEIHEAIRGRDDGQGVQLEAVNPREPMFEISRKVRLGQIVQPAGTDRAEWWKQQIAEMKFTPTQEFYHGLLPNRIGYPEELTRHMTGPGPSLIDNPDVEITLDRQPRLGPPGTVLLSIRVETTIGFNHLFFWIAPEKDYLVLRQETHYSKDRKAWDNLTRIIDTVAQSPKGRWYATKARYGRIEKHGDDLPAERVELRLPLTGKETGMEIGPTTTQVYRYLVAALRSLPQSIKAVKIATTEIGGIECPGFRIEEPQSTLLVWVDPKTGLPVRAERSYAKAINEADRDVVSVTERYDDMKFDEPLSDDLLSVTPPDRYAVTTVGTPPGERQELFSMPLVVTPKVGVGPLKFGASRAEILRLLGKPDREQVHIPSIPITAKTSNVDGMKRPPGADLVVLTKLHTLRYWGLGLSLTLEAEAGLRGIQCMGQDSVGAAGRTFRGATDKGIRIGSSAEDVLAAYGEPDKNPADSKQKNGMLKYRELYLEFAMSEKQTVRFISVSDSGDHRLRFEWRVPKE